MWKGLGECNRKQFFKFVSTLLDVNVFVDLVSVKMKLLFALKLHFCKLIKRKSFVKIMMTATHYYSSKMTVALIPHPLLEMLDQCLRNI